MYHRPWSILNMFDKFYMFKIPHLGEQRRRITQTTAYYYAISPRPMYLKLYELSQTEGELGDIVNSISINKSGLNTIFLDQHLCFSVTMKDQRFRESKTQ